MQIILISDRLAKARSVTLSAMHLLASATVLLLVVLAATAAVYWLTLRYAGEVPALQRLVLAAQETDAERNRTFVQQNLNAMAVKLGEALISWDGAVTSVDINPVMVFETGALVLDALVESRKL